MEIQKKTFTLGLLADTFNIERVSTCEQLSCWLDASYTLTATQQELFNDIFEKAVTEGNYWNESQRRTVRTQNRNDWFSVLSC